MIKVESSCGYCPICRARSSDPRLVAEVPADLGPFRFLRICAECVETLADAIRQETLEDHNGDH